MDILRLLKREIKLPASQSFFLLGPRQTGKTTLIQQNFPAKGLRGYNLLLSDEFRRLAATPELLREEVAALDNSISHVFIDEVQRIPELLNEVQYLIDSGARQKFILTGSSARKIKRGQGNLLAGRAWNYHLYPLSLLEIGKDYSLSDILSFGMLPQNIVTKELDSKVKNLRAYVDVYLKEEIETEALSRNIGGFIRFLSVAAQQNGEQLNYSNIARDVGISSVTIKEYFKILEDTLVGFFLLPFAYSERKRHKLSPKFYFFDTGVLRALQKRLSLKIETQTFEFGNYFETFLINETLKISAYQEKDLSLSFLRTANNVEVDLVIQSPKGDILGVEIKSKPHPIASDFKTGFQALKSLAPKAKCICVSTANKPRIVEGYEVLPYTDFLKFIRSL